jgi:hypothetical protein
MVNYQNTELVLRFDDLWDYMENITAPRYKGDRSYGDNQEGSYIK